MSEEKPSRLSIDTEPNADAFTDPVLRCDSCQALIKRTALHKFGACTKCGNKRMRNLTIINDEEKLQMEDWGFYAFANEYEAVGDE